jgi:protein subunit release factor A
MVRLEVNSVSSSTSPSLCARAITEQKQKMKRLGSDLTSAQKEMKTKHKAYENAVSILSRRLQEALAAKEAADTELNQLRAQSVSSGSDPVLHVGKRITLNLSPKDSNLGKRHFLIILSL